MGCPHMHENPKRKQLVRWMPTILYIALIIFSSSQRIPKIPGKHMDKLVHLCVYGVLSALAYRSFFLNKSPNPLIKSLVLSLAIGILDEIIQSFTPVRTASLADLLADGFGALVGAMLCLKAICAKPVNTD